MKLDNLRNTVNTAENGQERLNLTPQNVYRKVGDATDLDDCGNDPDVDVDGCIDNDTGDTDVKAQLLAIITKLLSMF